MTYDGIEFLPVFLFGNGSDVSVTFGQWKLIAMDYIGTFGRQSSTDPDNIDFDLNMTCPQSTSS